MINPIKVLNRWLNSMRSLLKLPWVRAPQSITPSRDRTLPTDLKRKLSDAIQTLPIPLVQVDQVIEELRKSLQQWREYDNSPNVLVVLSEPVQSTTELLAAVPEQIIQDQDDFKNLRAHRLDHWSERPADYIDIDAAIGDAIATMVEETRVDATVALAVIPALERYFLRCVDGLEAIETVRQAIVDHPECFWLVGCNRWAWSYLDKVCYLSAYLDDSFELPTLSALDIRQWLKPLNQIAGLSPFPTEEPDPKQQKSASQNGDAGSAEEPLDTSPLWRSEDEQDYFEAIEKEAGGIASVAAAAWLYSLQQELVDPTDPQPAEQITNPDVLGTIKRGPVDLPDASSLTGDEKFLLYAILLHGSLSGQHLVLDLAEPAGKVQAQLQALKRRDLIEKKPHGWTVNPAYFLSIRKDLSRNNFLLG